MSEPSKEAGLRILGVTGGVGAGKSTVANAFAEALGASLLDADAIVSELLTESQVLESIEVRIGAMVRDDAGALDRKLLGQHVFHHPEAREQLEGILHPLVRKILWQSLDSMEENHPGGFAVLDIPLLREGGLDRVCDFVVHVAVPPAERCARACARHGWSPEQWEAREAAQMQETEKAALADAILDNLAGLEALPTQVQALAESLHCLPPRPLRQRWPAWDLDPIP
ncbi:MAG: dephospho-CoA kinase [Planctomycetota bacterium]